MHDRFSSSMTMVAITAAAVGAAIAVSVTDVQAQVSASSGAVPAAAPTLKTPWGEPDLQGIWTDESDTPLQRSPRVADQEFFTEAQRGEMDRVRSAGLSILCLQRRREMLFMQRM